MKKYTIYYGFGTAILYTPHDPKERFYTLAGTCFGIRKSIGEGEMTMAKEYIERSIAITVADYAADEHPYKQAGEPETYSDYNRGWNDACDYIREKLENAQAADVAPVVHGRWTEKGYCSRCGCDIPVMEDDYCPKCGARMDGED